MTTRELTAFRAAVDYGLRKGWLVVVPTPTAEERRMAGYRAWQARHPSRSNEDKRVKQRECMRRLRARGKA